MKCLNCNKVVDIKNKYCSNCGSKLKKTKYCSSCGKEVSINMIYCPSCGKKINGKTLNYDFNSHDDFNLIAICWIIFVLVFTFIEIINNLLLYKYFYFILEIILFIFYLLMLVMKNRNLFFPILIVAFIVFILNLLSGINYSSSVLGLINPLITGLLISISKEV